MLGIVDVGQHQVDGVGLQHLQGLHAVTSLVDVAARDFRLFEDPVQDLPNGCRIVDDQDIRGHGNVYAITTIVRRRRDL
jgi:hypothetical protein